MSATVNQTFEPAARDLQGLNRALSVSFAVHIGAVLFLLLAPREWFSRKPPESMMTISLGGTTGPRSTGMTSVGGKTVEEVAPPPKRPELARPVTRKEEVIPLPRQAAQPPPKPAKPATVVEAAEPVPRPVTGRQVTQGNTPVDTGATGLGAGLTFGGGGPGGESEQLMADFCCREYLTELTAAIASQWQKNQPERGTTRLKFTIYRDGSIRDVVVEESSGVGVLDRYALSAIAETRLRPLPAAYTRDTLIIHLSFPYIGTP